MASTNGTGESNGSPYSPVYKDRLLDENEVCACFVVENKRRVVSLIDFPDFLNEFKRSTTQSLDSFLEKCSIGSKATIVLTEIAYTVYLIPGEEKQKVAMVVEGANVDPPDPLQSLSAVLTKFLDHCVFWQYQPKRRRRSSMIGLSNIEEVFRTIDINGDGLLQRGEFKQGLLALGVQFDDDQMNKVFTVISDDKDSINYHQFFRFVMEAEGKTKEGETPRSRTNSNVSGFKELAEVRQAICVSMEQPPFKQLKDPQAKIRKLKYLEKALFVMRYHCADPTLDKAGEQKWLNRWKMHRERIAKYQELLSTYIGNENKKLKMKLKASTKKKERSTDDFLRREQEFMIQLAEKEMALKMMKKSDRRRARSNSLPTANPQNTELFNLRRELKQLNREKIELQTKLRKKEQQQLQRVFGEKKQRIAEMDHHLKTLHMQLRKLRKEKQSLAENYETLRRDHQSKVQKLESKHHRRNSVSRKKAEKARDVAERQNENLRKLNRQLKSERKQLTQQVITLEGQVQRIGRKLQLEAEPTDKQNALIGRFKQENKQLKDQLRDLLAQHSTTVRSQAKGVEELEKKLNQTESQLEGQARAINELQDANSDLRVELSKKEAHTNDHTNDHHADSAAFDNAGLVQELQELREDLRNADEQLAEAGQFEEENRELKEILDKQRMRANAEIDRVTALNHDLREERGIMGQRIQNAEAELGQARDDRADSLHAQRQSDAKYDALNANKEGLQAEVDHLRRSNHQLQQAIKSAPPSSSRSKSAAKSKSGRKSSIGSGASPRPKKSKSGKKPKRTKTSKTPTKKPSKMRRVGPKNGLSPRRRVKKKTPRATTSPKSKSSEPSSTSSKTPLPDSPETGPSQENVMVSPQLPPETPRTPKVLDFSGLSQKMSQPAPKATTLPAHTTLPSDDEPAQRASEAVAAPRPGRPQIKMLPPESSSSSSGEDARQKSGESAPPHPGAPPPRASSAKRNSSKSKSPSRAKSEESKPDATEAPLDEDLERLHKRISDLDLQYRIKCEQIKALRNASKIFKHSISDKTEYQGELEKQLGLFQERLIDRNEELHARTNELKDIKERYKQLESESKRIKEVLLASQGGGTNEGMEAIMQELAAKDAEIASRDQRIQELAQVEKTAERLSTVKQLLETELESSGAHVKKLTAQLATLKARLEQLKSGESLKAYVMTTELQTKFLQAALNGDDGASDLEAEITEAARSEPRLKSLSSLLPQVRTRLLAHLEETACEPSQI